ncbi:MAG: hypothetical protein PHU80_05255 [Kiritimatiellae bacterium]|nr:hypothetical protein [Kiritimatiellia bacterium]
MIKELLIFPEDNATRDLILGFKESGRFKDSNVHVEKPGGGKLNTIRQLASWMPDLMRFPNRKVLFVLDSDSDNGAVKDIWENIASVINESLCASFCGAPKDRITHEKNKLFDRVFLLSWTNELEDLKTAMGHGKTTELGRKLADDIQPQSCGGFWQNPALHKAMSHVHESGKTECDRVREGLFPVLFKT